MSALTEAERVGPIVMCELGNESHEKIHHIKQTNL